VRNGCQYSLIAEEFRTLSLQYSGRVPEYERTGEGRATISEMRVDGPPIPRLTPSRTPEPKQEQSTQPATTPTPPPPQSGSYRTGCLAPDSWAGLHVQRQDWSPGTYRQVACGCQDATDRLPGNWPREDVKVFTPVGILLAIVRLCQVK